MPRHGFNPYDGYPPGWFFGLHRQSNQRALLIAALIFSVLVHLGLIVWLQHLRIGQVDPSQLNDQRGLYKVSRADNDTFEVMPDQPPPEAVRNQALVRESATLANQASQSQTQAGPVVPIERPAATRSATSRARAESAQPSDYGNIASGLGVADATGLQPPISDSTSGLELVFIETPSREAALDKSAAMQSARSTLQRRDGPDGGVQHTVVASSMGKAGTPSPHDPPPAPKEAPVKPSAVDRVPTLGVPDLADLLVTPGEDKMKELEKLDDDFDYTVSVYERPSQEGWVRVDVTPRRSLSRLKTMPKDVIYVLDVSGSIGDDWAKPAIQGVSAALDALNPGDRFNVLLFADRTRLFRAEGLAAANAKNIDDARKFLSDIRAGGMTDVRQAISRLLVREDAPDRVTNIILISDGVPTVGMIDTRDVINLITRDNDQRAAIYGVGIGESQNVALLEFLAYRNRGYCLYAKNEKQVPTVIADLASRIRYPIMKDVRVGAVGLTPGTLLPPVARDIHQGQAISYYARYKQRGEMRMNFAGNNGEKRLEFTLKTHLKDAPGGQPTIERFWAWWRLQSYYNQILKEGETAAVRHQIDLLRKEYGFETLY